MYAIVLLIFQTAECHLKIVRSIFEIGDCGKMQFAFSSILYEPIRAYRDLGNLNCKIYFCFLFVSGIGKMPFAGLTGK